MRYKNVGFGLGSIFLFMLVGCGGNSSGTSNAATSLISPTGKITPFTTVAAMKAGAGFYVILDRPAGKVTAPIKLVGTTDDASGRVIYFNIANQPVGYGDSGSLVIDSKGNSVGALSSGIDANGAVFSATAIEDEESIFLAGPATKKPAAAAAATGDGLRRIVSGVSPYLWAIASKDKKNTVPVLFTLDTSSVPKVNKKVPMATQTSYSTTIYMMESYGDAVLSFTTGAVTTPYLGKLLCYGRPLNWEGGSQNIPCCYGKVIDLVNEAEYGYSKIGVPNLGNSAGTLVDDRRFGVIVDPTVTATPITISGTVTVNTNAPVTFNGDVAQDLDNETSFALLNISQGAENILNANEAAGSATGSATVNFADGTSQTVDLTDSNTGTLIADLYVEFEEVLYNSDTFATIPLSSITFNLTLTTS